MRLTDAEYELLRVRDAARPIPKPFENSPQNRMHFRRAIESISRLYNATEEEILSVIVDHYRPSEVLTSRRRRPKLYNLIDFAVIAQQPDLCLTTYGYYLPTISSALEVWASRTLYALSGQQKYVQNPPASMRRLYFQWAAEAGGREALLELLVHPAHMPDSATEDEKEERERLLRKMGEYRCRSGD